MPQQQVVVPRKIHYGIVCESLDPVGGITSHDRSASLAIFSTTGSTRVGDEQSILADNSVSRHRRNGSRVFFPERVTMQQGERQRGCISLDLIGASIAATAGILLCVRALGRFDNSWDGTHYHLVLAALRAHILTFNDFEPIPNVVAFYHSYPRLLDTVRGYVWRFTGSILILQTFNLIAIAALVTFWRWRFGLSIRWTLVAILLVPLIQISATTLYVDTFANCFFAIAISAFGVAFIDRRPLVRSEFIVALAALAVSANVKPQFVVLATIALTILCIYQLLCLMRQDAGRTCGFFSG